MAEKLKQEGRHEIFEQETMEELEDDEGNVYNRKTYEDLKKQGLIQYAHGVTQFCFLSLLVLLTSILFRRQCTVTAVEVKVSEPV